MTFGRGGVTPRRAYKLAVIAYNPIVADLEALSAHGFCPGFADPCFETLLGAARARWVTMWGPGAVCPLSRPKLR